MPDIPFDTLIILLLVLASLFVRIFQKKREGQDTPSPEPFQPDRAPQDNEEEEQELRHYSRQLNLRTQPINLEAMKLALAESEASSFIGGGGQSTADEEGEVEDLDGDGIPDPKPDNTLTPGSVAECIRQHWSKCAENFGTANCSQWSTLNQIQISSFGIDFPWCT